MKKVQKNILVVILLFLFAAPFVRSTSVVHATSHTPDKNDIFSYGIIPGTGEVEINKYSYHYYRIIRPLIQQEIKLILVTSSKWDGFEGDEFAIASNELDIGANFTYLSTPYKISCMHRAIYEADRSLKLVADIIPDYETLLTGLIGLIITPSTVVGKNLTSIFLQFLIEFLFDFCVQGIVDSLLHFESFDWTKFVPEEVNGYIMKNFFKILIGEKLYLNSKGEPLFTLQGDELLENLENMNATWEEYSPKFFKALSIKEMGLATLNILISYNAKINDAVTYANKAGFKEVSD